MPLCRSVCLYKLVIFFSNDEAPSRPVDDILSVTIIVFLSDAAVDAANAAYVIFVIFCLDASRRRATARQRLRHYICS